MPTSAADHVRPSGRRALVWITDDSDVEAQLTERALGPEYDYEHFRDGSMVVERLAAGGRQPDVLLLDWVMPTMSGDEVVRFLRAQPITSELPVIIVTASRIETKDVVEGLEIGANDYVARPFVPEELRARVDAVIRAKRLREVAAREHDRVAAVGSLGRAFIEGGTRVEDVIDALASSLVRGLCDGCAISVVPGATGGMTLARHRSRAHEHLLARIAAVADPSTHTFTSAEHARATLPPAYHSIIEQLGISSIAVIPFPHRSPISGIVTVMRDGHSEPFEPADVATVTTCIQYTAMAFENRLRMDAERALRTQLQTILEQLPISIIATDAGGQITHINQSALDHVPGIRHARTIADLGRYASLLTDDDVPLTLDQYPISCALRGEFVRGVELAIEVVGDRGESSRGFIRASAVPLRDARGNIVAAITAFDDITNEHAAAAERAATAEFHQLVLGIVSHDLRNPLQTLHMGVEGVRLHARQNPKLMQLAGLMEATTRRMQGIIEQLLDLTRTRLGGGIPLAPAETDLDGVVAAALEELALGYPGARLEPRLERVRGTWDSERLAQVVINLVGNAIQHGAPAAPIRIETGRDGHHAVLRVENRSRTGVPLTDAQIASFFSPFRGSTRKSGGSGLGLGLYIANEIVRAHHGEIVVDSDPHTTTFIVRLPLHVAPSVSVSPSVSH